MQGTDIKMIKIWLQDWVCVPSHTKDTSRRTFLKGVSDHTLDPNSPPECSVYLLCVSVYVAAVFPRMAGISDPLLGLGWKQMLSSLSWSVFLCFPLTVTTLCNQNLQLSYEVCRTVCTLQFWGKQAHLGTNGYQKRKHRCAGLWEWILKCTNLKVSLIISEMTRLYKKENGWIG